jgi:hypothetical protein
MISIKVHCNVFYPPKKLGTSGSWVSKPFFNDILDLHTSIFKLTMKSKAHKAMEDPRNENHVTIASTCHVQTIC